MEPNWLKILDTTLAAEGVDPEVCPKQFFAENIGNFYSIFKEWLSSRGDCKKVTVFVDGVNKFLLNTHENLDSCFLRLGLQAGIDIEMANVAEVLGVPSADLHASWVHLPALRSEIRNRNGHVFVVLGGGTLTDLIKHALYLENPSACFVSIPTALSVTAFTSSFAVLEKSGAKSTYPSRQLSATFWIEDILCAAPMLFSRAGYGDLLARFVAYADWYLGHKLKIVDRYDEVAYRLMEPFSEVLQSEAEGFGGEMLSRSTARSISAALAMAGIAMSVSKETTPLSGFEHVISHGLDFLRLTSGRDLVLHGEQVGLASLTSATVTDWILDVDFFREKSFRRYGKDESTALVRNLIFNAPYFGANAAAPEHFDHKKFKETQQHAIEIFAHEFHMKNEKWLRISENFKPFLKEWEETKSHLKTLRISASVMESLLIKSKLPLVPEDLTPATTAQEYRWAVRFSPFLRKRMSVGDLVFWMGEDPALIAAL